MLSIVFITNLLVSILLAGIYISRSFALLPALFQNNANLEILKKFNRNESLLTVPLGIFEGTTAFVLLLTAAFAPQKTSADIFFFNIQGIALLILFFSRLCSFLLFKPELSNLIRFPDSANFKKALKWGALISVFQFIRISLLVFSVLTKSN
jgi:hypothetical protein